MKTFLGFTTGVLGGTIIGTFMMAFAMLISPELRSSVDKLANETK